MYTIDNKAGFLTWRPALTLNHSTNTFKPIGKIPMTFGMIQTRLKLVNFPEDNSSDLSCMIH